MKDTLKFAFIHTIPIMLGYVFMGIAFGLMLEQIGYNFVWAFFIALVVFAGSMQFVLVTMLTGGWSLLQTIIMTFSVNSRHIFYGLTFIERFKAMGKAYPYMIFALTDETYALLCNLHIPKHLDKKKTTLTIAMLNQGYWILGCTLGAALGQIITFNIEGVDFAMTALFVVIFVEQWLEAKTHLPAIVGGLCGGISLFIFEPSNFLLPGLLASVAILIILKNSIVKREDKE